MAQALVCMSHSPLLEHTDPPADVKAAVEEAFDQARRFAKDFNPDLIVNFGPDHYNGFFYDLMPPFCIGYEALGTGDYDSWEGPINVPESISEELAQYVIDQDIDTAISRSMEVDHGAVQPTEIIFGGLDVVPMVPIFVNSVARPFAKVSRVRRFGQAVGEFFKDSDKRVLFLGSGGLSHDPPVPQIATATPEQRAFLTNGRHPTPEARAARQQRTIDTAIAFAKGEADIMELNPEWDRAFLDVCRSGDVTRFDAYTADEMDAIAGHSSHEVRTWVAAYSALRACGEYEMTYEFYKPIKEYIAGFSSFNESERVRTVFDRVDAVRKVWLIHPEYDISSSTVAALSAEVFEPSGRIPETDFWSDFLAWMGSSIPPGARVLVDITGMHRPHILLLPLFLRQWGLAGADFLYSDPVGYEGGAGTVFSKGVIERVAQVPALEGAHDARIAEELLIIGAGYDSRLVAELAKSRARAKHKILLGLPGLQPQMYQESQLRVAAVGESISRLSDRSFVYCAASDPWVTAATLREIVREERASGPINLYLSPVGPKTQVLGFGWFFLTDERNQPSSMLFPYTTKYSTETSHGLARSHVFSLELDWILP